jgi:hypothetical protein
MHIGLRTDLPLELLNTHILRQSLTQLYIRIFTLEHFQISHYTAKVLNTGNKTPAG